MLTETLSVAEVERVTIHLGCWSDPRFLESVPSAVRLRADVLVEIACPPYRGRVLNGGDVAYVFGEPPAPRPGAMVLPGERTATKSASAYIRSNWDARTATKAVADVDALPHPTPRKLEHVAWLIEYFGGESIIDPFMGERHDPASREGSEPSGPSASRSRSATAKSPPSDSAKAFWTSTSRWYQVELQGGGSNQMTVQDVISDIEGRGA